MTLKGFRAHEPPEAPAELPRFLRSMQAATREALEPLQRIPILDGVLLEDLSLSSAPTKVPHKLARKYRGWIVVKRSLTQHVYQSATDEDDKTITLTASGPVVVSIWVF